MTGEKFEVEVRDIGMGKIVSLLRIMTWELLAVLAALAIMHFSFVKTASALDAPSPAAVVCEDDYQALRYALGDDVKQKVMRVVQRCWTVGILDGPASTARLEDLLDGNEDPDTDAP